MSKTIARAIEVRVGGRLKSTDPRNAFENRLKAPRQILDCIEATSLSPATKLEARRLFIVCICAAFETFWRDTIRSIVKKVGISESLKRALAKQPFSLADLSDVFGRELTIAELVACSYTFQHPDAVRQAISDALGIDAFAELRKARFAIVEIPRKNRRVGKPLLRSEVTGEYALRQIKPIIRCFAIRHETVHHVGHNHRVSRRDVALLEGAISNFNMFLSIFLENRIGQVRRSNKALQQAAASRKSLRSRISDVLIPASNLSGSRSASASNM